MSDLVQHRNCCQECLSMRADVIVNKKSLEQALDLLVRWLVRDPTDHETNRDVAAATQIFLESHDGH